MKTNWLVSFIPRLAFALRIVNIVLTNLFAEPTVWSHGKALEANGITISQLWTLQRGYTASEANATPELRVTTSGIGRRHALK